jgi:hypothetical protein
MVVGYTVFVNLSKTYILMKILLNQDIVLRLTLGQKPVSDKDGKIVKTVENQAPYLVTDSNRKSPPGFGVKVGKTQKSYIIQRRHGSRVFQVTLGNVAKFLSIEDAREEAKRLSAEVETIGMNPNVAKRLRSAAEITLGECFDDYLTFMTTRAQPAKENTIKSFKKGRKYLAAWEKIKVRDLQDKAILDRFKEIAAKTRTTAEQTFRMASTCVNFVIANDTTAKREGGDPVITYNPFTVLTNQKMFRSPAQLEKSYRVKGVRRPLTVRETLGPFLNALWGRRKENPTGCDYLLTCFILGTRKSEASVLLWRETLSDEEVEVKSWACLETRRIFFCDTKNHTDLLLPMPDGLFELLKQRRDKVEDITTKTGQWVFPARSNRSPNGNYKDSRSLLHYICADAGECVPQIANHDSRRTFGLIAEELTSYAMVKRLLNHRTGGDPTLRYTDPEWERTKEVQQKIECHLLSTAPNVYNALLFPKYPKLTTDPND